MLRAELHGKLPSSTRNLEDVLTSYVFGYLECAPRSVLRDWIASRDLSLEISEAEAAAAVFEWWPSYSDGTEPDVVIRAGQYYILVEAKYRSGFGTDRHDAEQNQLRRELRGGKAEAASLELTFILVTITMERYRDPANYTDIKAEDEACWRWTSWQHFGSFLQSRRDRGILGDHVAQMLLERGLRGFRGFPSDPSIGGFPRILFFDPTAAKYRGAYVGFQAALRALPAPAPCEQSYTIFFRRGSNA